MVGSKGSKAPPRIDVNLGKKASAGGQLSPNLGYAQRFAAAAATKQVVSSDAAPDLHAAEETQEIQRLPTMEPSPLPRPKSAPKKDPLADSAETLCCHTVADGQEDVTADQRPSGHGTASDMSHAQPIKAAEVQETGLEPPTGSADSHVASDAEAAIVDGSLAVAESSKDASRSSSSAKEVEVSVKSTIAATPKRKLDLSAAKQSFIRLFAPKTGTTAVPGQHTSKRMSVLMHIMACFRSPQLPCTAPGKQQLHAGEEVAKTAGDLAHADSILEQGQWRIGTQMEVAADAAAQPRPEPPPATPWRRSSRLPRMLSSAVSIAERLAGPMSRRPSWLPSFASPMKTVAEAEPHPAPADSSNAVAGEDASGVAADPEAPLSRLLVPQLSTEEMKPSEEVWNRAQGPQRTRVSLAQLMDERLAVAGGARLTAKDPVPLPVDTQSRFPERPKQMKVAAAPKEDINQWFLRGSGPEHSLSAYLTLRNPVLSPTLLDPESPAPWRSRSPKSRGPSRGGTPLSSPGKAAKLGGNPQRGASVGSSGAVARGLHLSPHQRAAAPGGASPLKPAAAAALAHLKQTRIASVAQRRAVSQSPQKSSTSSGRSWVRSPADKAHRSADSRKQARGPEVTVMADTLAVLHSHTQVSSQDRQPSKAHQTARAAALGPMNPRAADLGIGLGMSQPGGRKLQAPAMEAALRSASSRSGQGAGHARAARGKAAAQPAAPKQARAGARDKKQGTALERAVLQQYLAARRGRGSYAASSLLRRGRIPAAGSAASPPARTLQGEGSRAAHGDLARAGSCGLAHTPEQELEADLAALQRDWERLQAATDTATEAPPPLGANAEQGSSCASPRAHSLLGHRSREGLTSSPESLADAEDAADAQSTAESARKAPPNVAHEIVRWESRNITMGLDHQLAAAGREAAAAGNAAEDRGALSLELLDQLFERDLAGNAAGDLAGVPPGPMESQCPSKALPLQDGSAGGDAPADEPSGGSGKSPPLIAEQLPFSPGSRLFAVVAAKAASKSPPSAAAPAPPPLASDLKPQRLSPAFGEAAALSAAASAPAGAGDFALSGVRAVPESEAASGAVASSSSVLQGPAAAVEAGQPRSAAAGEVADAHI